MKIGNFDLDEKVLIIAEMSANHGHDITIAKRTIKEAKEAGADVIKIQTYTADTLTIECDNEYFRINSGTIWDGRTLYDLYKEAYTPWEWHEELMQYAKEIGIMMFSTPFDVTAVDLLESLEVKAYKVASFEIVDTNLIKYIASKGKPIFMSTGIATIGEIDEAVRICKSVGNHQIVLLKCTSSYPAKAEDANLKTIENLKETFNVEVGLSDHTLGIVSPIVAVALGARVIEKHFILDKSIGGPDASFSLDKYEFAKMVKAVREAELSIGVVDYEMTEHKYKRRELSRSLFVVEDIKANEVITNKNVRSIRPGYGIESKNLETIIGKRATKDVGKGTPVGWDLIK